MNLPFCYSMVYAIQLHPCISNFHILISQNMIEQMFYVFSIFTLALRTTGWNAWNTMTMMAVLYGFSRSCKSLFHLLNLKISTFRSRLGVTNPAAGVNNPFLPGFNERGIRRVLTQEPQVTTSTIVTTTRYSVVIIGVQLFGSFQKIIMLPPPSFELTTNWLSEVLWTPQKIAAINLAIQECQM